MSPAGDVTVTGTQAPAITISLQDGEIIILTVKPSGITVLLRSLPVLLATGAILTILILLENFAKPLNDSTRNLILLACCLAAGLQVVSAGLRWLGTLYVLTNRRVIHLRGLAWSAITDCNLTEISQVSVTHSSLERPFGLGSLNFSAESGLAVTQPWTNINRPYEIAGEIRKAIHHTHNGGKRQ